VLKFSVPISKIAAAVTEDVERTTRAIAFEVFQRIIYRTPVDEGRARGNWQIALSNRKDDVLEVTDTSGGATVAAGAQDVSAYKGGMSIHISNNLVYINSLEFGRKEWAESPMSDNLYAAYKNTKLTQDGHSKQAPYGMVRITLRELPEITQSVGSAIRAMPRKI